MKFILLMLMSFSLIANEDPWEEMNRSTFEFNQTLDENIFEPVAKSYKENAPKPMQNRVSDFSSNVGDIGTLGNEIAQLEILNSANTLGRVLINSTIGLFGLFDVASDIGLEKTKEDFGQTLAVWGTPEGPYVVLPVLGPSSVRGATGVAVDGMQKVSQTKHLTSAQKIGINITQAVDTRVKLLPATDLLKKADDPYITTRSAYLQSSKYNVYNGDLPDDDEF
ncbi:MlaA family lipoprotein [Bathymodiolus septemdierum thioautotrophic gill symbiont]|uniref:VacJ family lipoprotein n=1 Tax=endosymbiont of Bathymodiolus septemdierum str. Myojin knoll TaxID=1303921 RepID=A0A0P0UTA4_9GAMM|nr:VacJ family lipoprotein [Bathymodiolus septemdierum thioautotrophic gill symbiont]BAS68251.1 VacJ family lipoprotein [endosymbiont of Bathymodiolus septemdierum str. Myojin knoll]